MKKSFLIAAIIASVTSVTFAANDKTVTSKSYVDTKQTMIPATGTNSDTPGDTVVTYTDTAGTIGERLIATSMLGADDSDLASVELIGEFAQSIENDYVQNNSLTEETVHDLTCANPACDLYEITELTVYTPSARSCSNGSDCACYENGQFVGEQSCQNGKCTGECAMH